MMLHSSGNFPFQLVKNLSSPAARHTFSLMKKYAKNQGDLPTGIFCRSA